MNYDEFIQNIIDTRGQWSDEVFYSKLGCEKHHIIPACIGGEGDIITKRGRSVFYKHSHHPNCIYLYPAEHFIAHKLLYEENPNVYGLYAAWIGTTKNNSLDVDDYEQLKQYNHNLPDILKQQIEEVGEFHYNVRTDGPKTSRTYSSKEEALKHGVHGEKNGMYNNGYKISRGKNGHASIRYFYKDVIFECRKDLIEYLTQSNIKITSSAIRAVVHNRGTNRVYMMYKDVFDNLRWEYKDEN